MTRFETEGGHVLFPTAEYALFFLAVFALSWSLLGVPRAHKAALLIASYGFYAFWDWRFLPVLVGISVLAAAVGRALQKMSGEGARKGLLAAGVSVCLAALFFFKYLTFVAVEAMGLLSRLGVRDLAVRLPELALPVGISFFTFHAVSLMVDAYRGKIPVRVTFLDSLLYVAFFPQLVAGPILRASRFLPQLAASPDSKKIDAARALELIALGLLKKVLVANFLATRLVDPLFEAPAGHGGVEALLGIYGYAAQIYCDFSGYTDLATGSALLLGYQFPANFAAPYLAGSPQEFWRRWHISLSTWLRDYLFIPLGGSRVGAARTMLNLGVTMILGGLWHGANWTFVLWGALHGAGLLAHRLWSQSTAGPVSWVRRRRLWPTVARLLTFHFVCLGWVLFRAPSLASAGEVLGALAGPSSIQAGLALGAVVAIVAGVLGQGFPEPLQARVREAFGRLPLVAQGLTFAALVLGIEAFGPQGIAPFIYFQF